MFTVGLDEMKSLILYSQLNIKKVEEGKKVMRGEDILEEPRDAMNLGREKEIIFGSLLGDGQLEMPPRGVNARFGLIQSEGKRDYILSVLESLKEICTGKYREYSYYDKRTGKVYKSISFWSKASPKLNGLYRDFYEGGVKKVPLDLSLLTPLAIAHWVAQDGSRGTSKGLYLCTDGFLQEDVRRLRDYMVERYRIKGSIHKIGGRYRIYILAKSVEIVRDKILPDMHESMLYKLGI